MKESENCYRYVSINKLLNSGNKFTVLISNIFPVGETENSKVILRKKQISENLDIDINLIRASVQISNNYYYEIQGEKRRRGIYFCSKIL